MLNATSKTISRCSSVLIVVMDTARRRDGVAMRCKMQMAHLVGYKIARNQGK